MKNFRTTSNETKPKPSPALKPHFVAGQREKEAEEREKLNADTVFMQKERKRVQELFSTKLHNRFPQH